MTVYAITDTKKGRTGIAPSRFSAVYQCNSCATDSQIVDLSKTELVFRLDCAYLSSNYPKDLNMILFKKIFLQPPHYQHLEQFA